MVDYAITDHPLLEEWATDDRLTISEFHDNSLKLTARYLISKRLQKDEKFKITHVIRYQEELENWINDLVETESENSIVITDVEDGTYKEITDIDLPEGFKEVKDIELKISDFGLCRVFLNETRKLSIVIVHRRTYISMKHFFVGIIRRLAPWIFEDKPLTEEEKEYLATFFKTNREMKEVLNKILNNLTEEDKKKRLDFYLSKYSRTVNENAITNKQRQICRYESDIEGAFSLISSATQEMRKLNYEIIGMRSTLNKSDDNLVQFFLDENERIRLLNVGDNGSISIRVLTALENYDQDIFDTMIEDSHSILLSEYYYGREASQLDSNYRNVDTRKTILKQLFGGSYKIKMYADYTLNTADISVYASADFDCDYVPNPHIYYHNCLGDNKRYIIKYLQEGNIIDALAQCEISAGSVNLAEEVTSPKLIRILFSDYAYDNNRKIILSTETGKSMTMNEFRSELCNKGLIEG